MDWDDYFRQQAVMYRQLAEQTQDAFIKQELLDLAAVCEEVANSIERGFHLLRRQQMGALMIFGSRSWLERLSLFTHRL